MKTIDQHMYRPTDGRGEGRREMAESNTAVALYLDYSQDYKTIQDYTMYLLLPI